MLRIVQEAITNVLKRARKTFADRHQRSGWIHALAVVDDGCGLDSLPVSGATDATSCKGRGLSTCAPGPQRWAPKYSGDVKVVKLRLCSGSRCSLAGSRRLFAGNSLQYPSENVSLRAAGVLRQLSWNWSLVLEDE